MAADQIWRLCRGEELLGEIRITGSDFPWLLGTFLPDTGFAEVKPAFDAELALVQSAGDLDVQAWEATYQQIRSGLSLITPEGLPVAEFLLHIEGDQAWFRWSDEPFS